MKKVILVVCTIVMVLTTTAQTDTIVNNGDGKVVIIDKRPRTVINRQMQAQNKEPIIISLPENRDLENYLYYQKMADERNKNLLSARDSAYEAIVAIMVILFVLSICVIVVLLSRKNTDIIGDIKNPEVPYSYFNPVFHIHGANSSAVIDGSETAYHHQTYQRPGSAFVFVKEPEQNGKKAEPVHHDVH